MRNGEIVTNYRDNVFAVYYLRQRIEWNLLHGLPVQSMEDEREQLIEKLMLFEEIMDRIEDRRARIVIIARYALGMNERDIAARLNLTSNTIGKICRSTLSGLTGGPSASPPINSKNKRGHRAGVNLFKTGHEF